MSAHLKLGFKFQKCVNDLKHLARRNLTFGAGDIKLNECESFFVNLFVEHKT